MTARKDLAEKLARIVMGMEKNESISKIFSSYNIQMKRNHKKSDKKTAREEAISRVTEAIKKDSIDAMGDILGILHPFRIQEIKKKYASKTEESPRKKCKIIDIKEYKDEKSISYGYVAGGPASRSGSKKICPKCNSMGLHLAVGYKERYYSCVYCGFHKDLETKTYNY